MIIRITHIHVPQNGLRRALSANKSTLSLDGVVLKRATHEPQARPSMMSLFRPSLITTTLSLCALFFIMALLYMSLTILTGDAALDRNAFNVSTCGCSGVCACRSYRRMQSHIRGIRWNCVQQCLWVPRIFISFVSQFKCDHQKSFIIQWVECSFVSSGSARSQAHDCIDVYNLRRGYSGSEVSAHVLTCPAGHRTRVGSWIQSGPFTWTVLVEICSMPLNSTSLPSSLSSYHYDHHSSYIKS